MTETVNTNSGADVLRRNVEAARGLLDTAAAEGRDLTAEEAAQHEEFVARARSLSGIAQRARQIDEAMQSSGLASVLYSGAEREHRGDDGDLLSLRLGEQQLTEVREAVSSRERRAVLSASTPISGGMFSADVVPFYREPQRIASLLRQQQSTAPTIFYPRITTGATAAAPVAEGALKPQSNVVITRTEAPFVKLAHWLEVSHEALDDHQGLAQVLQAEGMAGLVEVESQQLLTGTGTAGQLLGLVGASGTLTYAKAAGESRSIALRQGMNVLRTTGAKLDATAIVMHPSTWTKVETEVDTQGQYLNRPGTNGAAPASLWGLPVITSTHISTADALVANFPAASMLYVRQSPMVIVDPYSASTSNLVRIIVEERISHALVEPRAVLRVTGMT